MGWTDPSPRAGLTRSRQYSIGSAATRWLIENNLLEREEETEKLRDKGEGLPDYDYGSVFRITDTGREQLEEIWEEQRQQ
jgi:hypothetical protein